MRGVVTAAAEAAPGLPLVAGGKSLAGRMTSGAAAKEPLPGVRGLVFRESREGNMASYWILKTEPTTYGFHDLEREKSTVWDGVRNNLALKYVRQMAPGDQVLVYHSGAEKAVVGRAEVVTAPYPDPKSKDSRLVVVEIKAKGRLAKPVPLAAIKADRAFADLALVRMGRLSVMPATPAQWQRLLALAGSR